MVHRGSVQGPHEGAGQPPQRDRGLQRGGPVRAARARHRIARITALEQGLRGAEVARVGSRRGRRDGAMPLLLAKNRR